ncbi:aldo/keto reductase [Micromonospora sp. CPCC 205711]|uniref:aldo/keto reductase n=1 Tax=Micromonospora sp. CPCC 205547 TaxID=3122400 RepID=UPI002FF15377
MSLPENKRKFDAADQLAELADEAGMTLIEMAIAFVLRHPGVTAPIIGPRTMEHLESQLAAADVVLPNDVLRAGAFSHVPYPLLYMAPTIATLALGLAA